MVRGQNKITDIGIIQLANSIKKLKRIKVLRLGFYM